MEREHEFSERAAAASGVSGGGKRKEGAVERAFLLDRERGHRSKTFSSEAAGLRTTPFDVGISRFAPRQGASQTTRLLAYVVPDGERAIVRGIGLYALNSVTVANAPFPAGAGFSIKVDGTPLTEFRGSQTTPTAFTPGIDSLHASLSPPPFWLSFDSTGAFVTAYLWNSVETVETRIHLKPQSSLTIDVVVGSVAIPDPVTVWARIRGWRWPIRFEADDVLSLYGD